MNAEHWLAAERRLIEFGAWTPPAKREAEKYAGAITVADYGAKWIEQRPVKARTRIGYEATLARYVTDSLIGSVPLRNLTADAVRSWYAAMAASKPTAKAHAYQLLHAVCATAVADGLLPSNPCIIPTAMATTTKRQPVILTPAEVAVIADAIEPERLRTMVLVMAWCGPRWGEVIELRRRDVAADGSTITVARGATHRQGVCRIDTPKSGRGRTVVTPPHIRADVVAHLATIDKGADALLWPPTRGGCHFSDRGFRDAFQAALSDTGREGVRTHDLRHFAGTQAARVGNLVETMGRLGHSTVKASLMYQSIVSGRDAAVAEALSKLAEGDGAAISR